MLLIAVRPVPRVLFVVPVAWSLVGSLAAVWLGVLEDAALLAAGAVATIAALRGRPRVTARAA